MLLMQADNDHKMNYSAKYIYKVLSLGTTWLIIYNLKIINQHTYVSKIDIFFKYYLNMLAPTTKTNNDATDNY